MMQRRRSRTQPTWQCVTLSTPFAYNGNNLEVIVETNATGGGNESSSGKAYRYNTATNRHQTWATDTTAPTGTGTLSNNRPNFQFNFAPPVVAPGELQFSSANFGGAEGGNVVLTISRTNGTAGTVGATVTLTDGTATGGAACTAGVDYINPGPQLVSLGDTVTSTTLNVAACTDAAFDFNETFTGTLSLPTGGATLGSQTMTTGTITNVAPAFSGSFDVGAGQNYTSLTNPDGIFQAINNSGVAGSVTINITSDLTGETGCRANEFASPFTLTIKPSGGVRSITSTAGAFDLISLNGADRVTIDGSQSGGTDRSLNLISLNTANGADVIFVASLGAGAGDKRHHQELRYPGRCDRQFDGYYVGHLCGRRVGCRERSG